MRTVYIAVQGGKIVSIFGTSQLDQPDGYQEVDIADDSPAPQLGGSVVDGQCLPPALAIAKSVAIRKIDVDVDVIYGAVLGNRAEEYRIAKEEAQAYKDAGYTGTVPASVSGYVTAKGWTATQATDDILATAAAWLAAKDAIRAARLLRKEQVRIATTQADINTAMAAWQAFVVYIKGQLGIS